MEIGTLIISLALDPHTILTIDEIDWNFMFVWATDEMGNGFKVEFKQISLV